MIYETYKSAKAAYPDCDAVLTTGPDWLGDSTVVGKFIPTYLAKGAGEYRICGDSFPGFIGRELGYVVAEPPTQPKQKTKVEYKRKKFTSVWEVVRHYETGTDLFTKSNCRDYRKIESIDDLLRYQFCLFVKRETPITWESEVMQHINGGPLQGVLYCFDVLFCRDQRIKNAAIEVCKLVAKRNRGCE